MVLWGWAVILVLSIIVDFRSWPLRDGQLWQRAHRLTHSSRSREPVGFQAFIGRRNPQGAGVCHL